MPKRHYHVCENTPGCLPESDPYVTTSRKQAGNYAYDLAQELRIEGYDVTGNKRDGYYGELSPNDLGRVIDIIECYDDRCLREVEW